MWNAINFKKSQTNKQFYFEIINEALTYDESFIREEAIYHLFKNYAHDFQDINIYLDVQEHPNYVFKLFKGALSSWVKYQPSMKNEILEYFKGSLDVMSVAVRSLRFLENIEDNYYKEGIVWTDLDSEDKNSGQYGMKCSLNF